MAKGSRGFVKPAENPGKILGQESGIAKSDYSQPVHSLLTGREIPRSLPFSEDGEKGVLCSLLLSPREVADLCVLRLQADAFYIPAHQIIYNLVLEFSSKGKPIDFVSLKQTLKDRNQLEEVGGAEQINALFSFVPSAANASYYIEIIREKYLLRRMILTCNKLSGQCYEQQEELEPLLDEAEREIFAITGEHVKTEIVLTKDLVMEAIEQIEKLYETRGAVTGLPTGFIELDRMTSGLHPSEMVVIAARPSMGKTALAMNIAEYVSMEVEKAVAVFSLEMSSQNLVQRLLCSRAKVNLQRVRNGFLNERDFPNLTAAAAKLAAAKMFIDDTPGMTITELRAKSRRLKSRYDIQLIVIDYLQLLRSMSRRAQDNRQLEISEISGGIKALAKELDVPIIVIAQLNRQPEARAKEGGRPRLSDLRESGSIEQDADLVGLLVRAEYYETDEDAKQEKEGEAELIIAKQRNGPTGDIPLVFLKEYTRFENRARDSR
ncbi:MAG: replicative DNA helicase [Verrucomicrobia bacterium]|nr:replicative DNA helicase [Verrucomicrobiota bacterium]MBV9674625.1 replicative DNA helicase [Verrucomicrobiota bacterium]